MTGAARLELVRRGGPRALAARGARPLGWIGLGALGLGALLAFPRDLASEPPRPALRALLVDASASAARRSSTWNLWVRRALREQALAAREAGEELAVVLYAADLERLYGPGAPDGWLARLAGRGGEPVHLRRDPPADLGSDLAGALELVADELEAGSRPPGRVVLLGDGEWTGHDPGPLLVRLGRQGVRAERLAPPAADQPDLALVELRLPSAPAPGEPLAASALLELRAGVEGFDPAGTELRASLEVLVDSAAGARRFELPLELQRVGPSGAIRFRAAIELGPAPGGRTLLRVRALLRGPGALRDGDPVPEDDALSALARSAGPRVAGLVAEVSGLPAARAWLASPGRFPGFQWLACTPAELAALLPELDLLVSFDCSHAALPREAVAAFVQAGGGWLHCGGWGMLRGFGGASAEERGLAALLPIDLARPGSSERDVLLLVDGSGSMAGEPFERVKQALVALAEAALPGDHLELRFFTAALGPAQALTAVDPAERRAVLARLLSTRVPGGPTAILDSLEQLARERARMSRPALAILLTDGRDRNAFDVDARAEAIRGALAASRTELAVIAAGKEADLGLLGKLLPPGRSPEVAEDLGELGELFQREILRDRVREAPALLVTPAAPAGLEALPPARAALEAELARPAASWPPLERYGRGSLEPAALALWTGVEGEPVCAMQRVGAGLVASWTSAPIAGWAPDWEGADELVGPLLRALCRSTREEPGGRIELAGGRLALLDAPRAWPARVAARVLAPALASAFEGSGLEAELGRLELAPPAAGAADVRAIREAPRPGWLARAPAGAPLRVELSDPATGALLGQLALAAPRPEEVDPERPSRRVVLEPPAAVSERAPPPRVASTLAPPLLLAGALLLALSALLPSRS